MTTTVWLAAALLFVLGGLSPRSLDWPARISVRFATGIAIIGTIMYGEALAGLHWTRAALVIPLLVCTALFRRSLFSRPSRSGGLIATLPAVPILLGVYAVATARITNADLLYFWGPKGVRFFFMRTVDFGFLKTPHYYLMHADYPPLQPIVYAWSAIAAHRFSYWGAASLAVLYLLATAYAFRGLAARHTHVTAIATLLAALLTFGCIAGHTAGGADPQLLMFEVIALAALTFANDHRIAAIALAGAAMTKVEGAAFTAVVVVAYLLVHRNWRRTLVLALPSVVLLGSWIAVAKHHGLLDSYARGRGALHLESLGRVLSVLQFEARYRLMYLPWIAALAPLLVARRWRAGALPLLVFAGTIAYTVFFYLHEADSVFWIKASAERVLLTPLAALLVATAAMSEYSPANGVVPQGEAAERGGREADGDPGRSLDQV